MKFRLFIRSWIFYALLAFPSFYFVYKYGTPDYGLKDFFDYYKLYKDWNIGEVEAPFNMRLVSTYIVHLIYKCGFHYDTAIAFDKFADLDKKVFFSAVFFNFLCIVSTCTILFLLIKKHFNNLILAFCSGLIYLLGFGTLFYEFMPITDALSVFLFALVLYYYLSKSYIIILPLVILILQREYVFLALSLIAALDLWKLKEKYYLHVLAVCILCFIIYFVLRKTVFYTPLYDRQASPVYFLESIFHLKFPLIPYIRQTLMTLNIFILFLILIVYKTFNKIPVDKFGLFKILLLFLQINIISFAAVFGNNTGRYFYILIPLIIYQLIKELQPLLSSQELK
ncbi:MAG: hypothetical protein ACXVNM_12860 [Bacteroidia bacterium]